MSRDSTESVSVIRLQNLPSDTSGYVNVNVNVNLDLYRNLLDRAIESLRATR